MEGLGVLLDETVDMAHALLVEDLIDGNEDACLLHLAKPSLMAVPKSFIVGERFM